MRRDLSLVIPASRLTPYALVALVCCAASLNIWLGPGILNTHAGGDSPFLLIRVYELVANLRAGIFPARWMPDAAFGLGYPFFNFYASLPYYFAAGLNLIGFDLITAIKLTQTAGMFLAAGSMGLLAKQFLPRNGALLAVVAYTLTPFHLANIYVRGDSLSEFWAFVWFPLILWLMLRGRGGAMRHVRRDASCMGLALALAGLVLTHNVSAVLFAPFIFIVALYTLIAASEPTHPSSRLQSRLIPLFLAAALALALSAWFWLPVLGEAGSAQLGNQTTGYFNYANHFRGLNLVQPTLLFAYTVSADLNVFAMGLVQAVLVVAGACVWLWSLHPKKATGTLAESLTLGLDEFASKASRTALVLTGALFLFSTFLLTPLSSFIWAYAPLLKLAQFPWRFLSVQAVFAALLVGGMGRLEIGDWRSKKLGWRTQSLISNLQSLFIAGVLSLSSLWLLPNERLNIRAEDVTPHTLQLYEWFGGNIGTTIRAEYLPSTVQPWPRIGFDVMGQPRRVLPMNAGDTVESQLLRATPQQQTWRIRVQSAAANVVLPVLASGGWRVEPAEFSLGTNPGSGWHTIKLPAGEHEIMLTYEGTPLQRWGERISLLAVALVLVWSGRQSLRRFKRLRLYAVVCLAAFVSLVLLAQLSRLLQPAPTPSLQAIDQNFRLFPHRGPITLRAPDQTEYELIGATISPTQLIAGQPFSLSLQWKDDRAPAQITVTQESPNASAYVRALPLFQFQRSIAPSNARISQQITLKEALPGPTLLKLSLGNWDVGEVPNGTMIIGPTITATLPSATLPTAPTQMLHTFANGIRLHSADILETSLQDFCFRPVWSRTAMTQNPADALQISMRLLGADGALLGQADWQPQGGLAPTWAWPNDVVIYDSACLVPFKRRPEPGEKISVQVVWYYALSQQEVDSVMLRGTYSLQPNQPPVVSLEK